MKRILPALIVSVLLGVTTPVATTAQEVEFVFDGDSFQADMGALIQNIRLLGIDCPEGTPSAKARREARRMGLQIDTYLKIGDKAAAFTRSLLPKGKKFRVEYDVEKRDKYGRLLVYVFLPDGRMVNEEIVKAGYADLFPTKENVKYKPRLVAALNHAKKNKLGIWAK